MFVEVLTRFFGNELVWLLFHEKIPFMKIIPVTLASVLKISQVSNQQRKCMVVYSVRYLSYTGHLSRSNVF